MGSKKIRKMPTADEIIAQYPITEKAQNAVYKHREEVEAILSGKDDRLLVIMGPCSAWPSEAVIEYAKRLKKLSDKVEKKIKILMRVYIQKPRTIKGWMGPVNQADPFETPDIPKGAAYCRDMMVQVNEMGLGVADEALFTHNAKGFAELLSWIAIGARSVEDQEHRIFASGLDCAVGMKNATSGSIELAVNGIVAAQHGHHAVMDGYQVETSGNAYAHLVLRGGLKGTNYDPKHVAKAGTLFAKHNVKNPAIIIDASHDNCKKDGVKDPMLQPEVVRDCIGFMKADPAYRKLVKGFMIESFLKDGAQKLEAMTPETVDRSGLSITDPCLGWESAEQLILELAKENI